MLKYACMFICQGEKRRNYFLANPIKDSTTKSIDIHALTRYIYKNCQMSSCKRKELISRRVNDDRTKRKSCSNGEGAYKVE